MGSPRVRHPGSRSRLWRRLVLPAAAISKTQAKAVGWTIPLNYPLVGQDAFRTATGGHAAAIIKAMLINGTVEMTGVNVTAPRPNGGEGWGRLNIKNVLNTVAGISADASANQYDPDAPVRVTVLPPRTIGLSLGYRFY